MTSEDPIRAANDLGRQAREKAHDVVDDAQDATRDFATRAQDYGTRAQGAAKDLYHRVQDGASLGGLGRGVVQQPVEALLLAGAIGYLTGWLLNR